MKMILLHILLFFSVLVFPSMLHAQIESYPYEIGVQFEDAKIITEGSDKYFLCNILLKGTTLPEGCPYFESLQLTFNFDKTCFNLHDSTKSINFTPQNPDYDLTTKFPPYGLRSVMVFYNAPFTMAEVLYTKGNEQSVIGKNLVLDPNVFKLWGVLKWKLLPGAAGRTGISISKEEDYYYNDVSAASTFLENEGVNVRLAFSGCSLDIEIPGAKPVVAQPVFAANQDTVICRPPVESTYTLTGLPTASDSCVWYVSTSPKGAVDASIAEVTRVGKGDKIGVEWKTTTDNKNYYLNVFSMSKGYSSDTVSKKINVIGFPTPTITEESVCKEYLLTYTPESGITGTWYNPDYSKSAVATTTPYGATEIGFHHLVRERGTCKDTVDKEVEKIDRPLIKWGQHEPPAKYDIATTPEYGLIVGIENVNLPLDPALDTVFWVKPANNMAGVEIVGDGMYVHTDQLTVTSLDFEVYVKRRGDGCITNTLTGHTEFFGGEMRVTIEPSGLELCKDGSVVLTTTVARGVEPYTWAWYKQGSSDTVRTEAYTVTGNATQKYGVKVTDSKGFSAIGAIEVLYNGALTAPKIEAGPNQVIASGDSTILTANAISGDAYAWYWGPKKYLSSNGQFADTKALTETQRFGIYTVSQSGCTSKVDSMTVTVDKTTPSSLLSVVVNPRKSVICVGNKVDFVVEAVTGDLTGATFEWLPADDELSNTNSSTTTYTATAGVIQKEYAVLVRKNGQTLAAKTMVDVNGSKAPILELKAPNLVKCLGDTIFIVNNGTIKPTNYHWFINNNPVVVNQDTNYVLTASGNYDIRVVGTTEGACTSDTLRLKEAIGTGAQIVGLTTTVTTCETSGKLEFTSITPTDAPFKWLKPDKTLLSDTDKSVSVSVSGDYYIVYGSGTCADTVTIPVRLDNGIEVIGLPDFITSCALNADLKFTSASAAGFKWLNSGKTPISGSDNKNPWNVTQSGIYYLALDGDSCSDTIEVSVALGVPPVLMVDKIQTTCGTTHTLSAGSSGGTIEWFKGVNTPLANTTVGVADGTSYRVTATDGSCVSDTVDVTVNFGTPPSVNVVAPQTACGNSLTLKGSATGGQLVWLGVNKQTVLTNLTVNVAGTYYAYAKDGSCFSADTVGVGVSFGVSPALVVDEIQTSCNNIHTLLAETSGGAVKWFKGNTLLTSATINKTQGSDYRVTAVDGSCASDTVDVMVNFGTPPSVNVVAPQTACGKSLTLKGSATGGQLVWLDTERKKILTDLTIVSPNAGTYYAYAKDGSCFSADTVGVDVSFGVLPVLMVDEIQTSCNNIHTLLADASGGAVKWFKGNTLLTSTSINKTQGSDYRVTAVDGSCASDTVDVTVNFGTPPSVNVVAPQTACGNSLTLKGTSTGGQLAWLDLDKQTALTNLTVKKAGTYYAYAKDGSCFSADTVGVDVSFGVPPVLTADKIQTACGTTHTLLAETSGGTLKWFKGVNTPLTNTRVGVADGTAYRVTATDGSCASDTADVTVNFGTPPSVNVITPQTACGNSLTLKGTSTGGQLVWLDTERKNILTNLTVNAAGTYYAYAKDGSCFSADTVGVDVSFGVLPVLTVDKIQTSCNNIHTLLAETSGGAVKWFKGNTLLTSTTIKKADGSDYRVTVVDGSCASDTVDVTVNFGTPPSVNVVAPQTACGNSLTLKGSATGGQLVWLDTERKNILPNLTVKKAGTYYAYAKDGSCLSADTVGVNVSFGVSPALVVDEIQTSCNNTHTLLAETSGGKIQWFKGNTLLTSTTINKTDGSDYRVTAIDGSCASDTVDVTVNFGTPPSVNVVAPQTACGKSLTLKGTSTGGQLVWLDTDRKNILTNLTVKKAGTYYAYAKDGTCLSSDTVDVTVSFGTPPSVNVTTPQTACGKSLTLKGNATGGQLVWLGLDKRTELPNLTVKRAGTYYAYAKDGTCLSLDTVGVNVSFGTPPTLTVDKIQTTCGTTHTLSAAASGGAIKWFKGNTLLTNTTINKTDGSDYRVTAVDGSCASDTVDVTVHFGTRPSVNVVAPQTACGNSLTLKGSASGGQLVWLGVDKATILTNLIVKNTGTYYAYAKDGSCLSSDTVGVNVSFGVSPVLMVDKIQTTCETTHTLSATASGGTVKWSDGTGLLSSTTITGTKGTTQVYSVIAIDGSCSSLPETVTVSFGKDPSVNVITPQTACGKSLTLKGSASGGQLVWLGSDKATILTNLTVTTPGKYYVYAKDGSCQSADKVEVDVQLETSPSINVNTDQLACGSAHVLTATASGGSVHWMSGGTELFDLIVTGADGDVKTFDVFAKDGTCESAKQTVTVTFGTSPVITLSEISCLGDTLWVEGSGSILDTYRWTVDGEIKQDDARDYYVFTTTGSYTVSCVGFVGTCESNSAVATIQINPTPTIAWTTQPQAAVSAGEMIGGCVTAAGGTAPYTTLWSVAGVSGDCFSIQALKPAYAFQAYVVDMNGCMSDTTTTAHVTVTGFGALAVTAEAVYGTEICANGSAILSADVVGGTAPYTYEWYEKGTPDKLVKSVVGNSLNDILTLLTPTAGTYVVKVKDSALPLAMGEAEVILTTTVKTAPVANAGTDLTVKTGEKAVLLGSATPQSANTQWYWTPADQFNDVAEANKQYPLTTKITGKKEFSLYVIDANGCVSQPDTMVVDVSATGVKLEVLPATSTLCQGNTQLLRVVTTPRVADSDITWSPATGLSVVNNDSTVFTPTASGNYTFIATVVSGGKTYTGRTEVTVNSGSAPMFDLVTSTGNTTLCQQDTVKVKYAAGAERATGYVWSIGGNSVGVDSFYVVNTVGTHEIKVSASSGSCAATEKSISVTVNQGPVIASLALIDSCGRAVVEVAGTGVTSYTWSATPTGAVDATNSNRYVITATGLFTVEVSATNGSCSMKKQLTGVINERPSLVWGTQPATTPYDPGDNVNVTVMATGGVSPYSYHWLQPTDVTETSGGYNLLNVSLANYTFEVYATDKNGCVSSDTLKESISVIGGAVDVTLASDYGDVICKDGYARLTAKIDGAAVPCTFSWYKGTDLVTAIKVNSVNELYNVLWVAAADADKYTVVVTDKNSKNGTADVTVSVDNSKTAPLASAGPDMTIPTGKQTVLLGEVTTAGTPTYQWHWSPADKLSALADTASQFPLTAMLTAQQSYSVYVVDVNNCVSGADDVQVDVNDATGLCLTATPVSAEVCRNNSVTFESEVTCGTVSNSAVYGWLPNTDIDRADTSVVKFGPATNGVYEYAVSVTENGVTAAARVKVTVKEMDAPKLDISGRWSCLGDTLVVKNNGFTEKEYIWTVDGIVVSEKSHKFALNVKNIQNVMVYATADNGCSSDTVNRTMKLGVIPPVNITEGSFAEYKDSVFVLNVDNDPLLTATDYTFAWSSTPDNKINGDKDKLAMTSVALSEDVRYIFTATDKNNPVCQGTDTITAYLIPDAPKLDIDKNADNNIVLSWDPLVNADSARIMFNEWDGYGVASAYKQRHMNKADITEYIVDVSNDTLEFFYVNASRYVAELEQSYHSHASDTMGYFRQWVYAKSNTKKTDNYITYPFDMTAKNIKINEDLGRLLGKDASNKLLVSSLGRWDFSKQQWVLASYIPSYDSWSGSSFLLEIGVTYKVVMRQDGDGQCFILYGKLPSEFSYGLQKTHVGFKTGDNLIAMPLSLVKEQRRQAVGNTMLSDVVSLANFKFQTQTWSVMTWMSAYGKWSPLADNDVVIPWASIKVIVNKDLNWSK